MDPRLSEAGQRFQREVRAWLATHRPPALAGPDFSQKIARERAWQQQLSAAGYVAVHWPVQDGGRGLGWTENFVLQEELALSDAPEIVNRVAVNLVGPTLIRHGTAGQRERFLQRIVRADDIWCQLFSEPDAGSDLRSLRTVAKRVTDGWEIRGQKVWVSNAQFADFGILLARLEHEPTKIGFFILDMRQPGVQIRPLEQMTREAGFNEVFLDSACVPDDMVVGDPVEGWRIAHTTLGYERATSPRQLIVHTRLLRTLMEQARAERADERTRRTLAMHYRDLQTYRLHLQRLLTRLDRGELPGADSSIIKLYWSEMAQRLHDTSMEMLGVHGVLEPSQRQRDYLYYRACTIFAGTSEIQRNTLADRVLGLPAEPRAPVVTTHENRS